MTNYGWHYGPCSPKGLGGGGIVAGIAVLVVAANWRAAEAGAQQAVEALFWTAAGTACAVIVLIGWRVAVLRKRSRAGTRQPAPALRATAVALAPERQDIPVITTAPAREIGQGRQIDPVSVLSQLGAQWSPDFAAYASGQIPASMIRCVLCGKAPCSCRFCEAVYTSPYASAFGRPSGEKCGFRLQPDGSCPRCGAGETA